MDYNSPHTTAYTPPMPAPMPYAVPPEFWACVSNVQAMSLRLVRENEQLLQRLRHKALKEEAYAEVVSSSGKTYVFSESGRALELMDDCILEAAMLHRDGPVLLQDQICLRFSARKNWLIMSEDDFLDNKRLLHKLQSAGIGVTMRKSVWQTATLIRQLVTKGMGIVRLSFYAGWTKEENSGPRFLQLEPFSTHQHDAAGWKVASRGIRVPVASEASTVKQFAGLLEPIGEDFLRWFLWVWFHTAFLFSLLPAAGKALSLGVCFYTTDPVIQTWLQTLLGWYGDVPVSLSEAPGEFVKNLWSRKDQPLVILEAQPSANGAKNVAALEAVLSTGKIPIQNHAESGTVPLQAPITLISGVISPLANHPDVLVLDISPGDIDRAWCCPQQIEPNLIREYLQVFAAHVEDHWPDLCAALNEGSSIAQTLCTAGSHKTLGALGVLLGVSKFTDAFLTARCPGAFSDCSDERLMFQRLTDQLEGLAFNASRTDLAEQFCQLAQKCLREKIYVLCPDGQDASGDARPPVYLYRGDYAFSNRAFRDMCRKLGASTVQVAHALSDARLLCGKTTNGTTVQTRIRLFNAHGISRYEGVYRIDGTSIELELF